MPSAMGDALASPITPEDVELDQFAARLEERAEAYLQPRPDNIEQNDHLRHVADRTRWLYFSEIQRQNPGASLSITRHENTLIDASAYGHDIGKWIPRNVLRDLTPQSPAALAPIFRELRFTPHEAELFLLALRRRFGLIQDGYTPEYDAAHHLVSAFFLVTDPDLRFHRLSADDQNRLINIIIGHQFGSYFKESLLKLSLSDLEVTTGMLVDAARPSRAAGDLLACAFHDADISDLLFVGSLERRPNREDQLHIGGLIKILLINLTLLVNGTPGGPETFQACLRSCQGTVNNVCKEFLTETAIEYGALWRRQANRFLASLRERTTAGQFQSAIDAGAAKPADRMQALRLLVQVRAREFLRQSDPKDE